MVPGSDHFNGRRFFNLTRMADGRSRRPRMSDTSIPQRPARHQAGARNQGGPGMAIFTAVHVLISLIGIVSGFVVINGFLGNHTMRRTTQVFLAFTVATSLTGFGFPFPPILPSHIVAVLSLVLLAVAIFALYGRGLAGPWRSVYVITAVMAQYFNVFVLIIQSFQRVPALKALAPTQSEPPFAIAQGIALVAFMVLGALSVRRFRPAPQSMRLGAT
jgi:hypothetical protein